MNLDEALDVATSRLGWLPPVWREDAAQGARFEVWRRFYPAATAQEVRLWARRGAIDEIRRSSGWRKGRTPQRCVPRDPTVAEDWPLNHDDPAEEAVAAVAAVAFLDELEVIDPRAVRMLLAHAEGDTLAAIGVEHGVTEGRVCQILTLARRRIDEVL